MARILVDIEGNGSGYTAPATGAIITDLGHTLAVSLNFWNGPIAGRAPTISGYEVHEGSGDVSIPGGWVVRANVATNVLVSIDTTPNRVDAI